MDEIVITVGLPGAGKSTHIKSLVDQGYTRINRDLVGGDLISTNSLVYQKLKNLYRDNGVRTFVLDNTYISKSHRAVVIEVARELGLPVRVLWLQTTLEQAQFLASLRQVRNYGHVLKPSEYAKYREDPGGFPPIVQYSFRKRFEEPSLAEGFAQIEIAPMQITLDPAVYKNSAYIFDYDGTLRCTKSGNIYPKDPSDVLILKGRGKALQRLHADGVLILGASNQSGIAKKPGDPKYVSEEAAIKCFEETNRLLGVPIDYMYAADRAGVPQSFLRKPLPGMGVAFIEKYKLDPKRVCYVGDMKSDKTFADRCGFDFIEAFYFFDLGVRSDFPN